jgi:hypothetical protein
MRPLLLGHPTILPAVPVNCAEKKICHCYYLSASSSYWSCITLLLVSMPGMNNYGNFTSLTTAPNAISSSSMQEDVLPPTVIKLEAIKPLEMATRFMG